MNEKLLLVFSFIRLQSAEIWRRTWRRTVLKFYLDSIHAVIAMELADEMSLPKGTAAGI